MQQLNVCRSSLLLTPMLIGGIAMAEEISDPATFAEPKPYVMNDGVWDYTGPSATVENDLWINGNPQLGVANADTVLTWKGTFANAGETFHPRGPGYLKFVAPAEGTTLNYNIIKPYNGVTSEFADYAVMSGNVLYGLGGSLILRNIAEAKTGSFIMGIDGGRCDFTVTDGTVLKMYPWSDFESGSGSGNHVINGSTLTVEKDAKVSHVALNVDVSSSATVTSGGILSFSRPNLDVLASAWPYGEFGSVTFDGGVLKSFDSSCNKAVDSRIYAQWFNGHSEITVGANGMTIQAPDASGVLWPYFKLAEGVTTATITKTGAGSLAIRPTSLPVDVQSGDLKLASSVGNVDRTGANGTVTFAADTSVTLAGEHSAAKMDLSGAPLVKFHPDARATTPGKWKANGWATTRADGVLQLGDSATSWNGAVSPGSAFRHEKIAVDRSFEIAFSVVGYNQMGGGWYDQYGGFALVFQNATGGESAVADLDGDYALGGFQGAVQENGVGLIVSGVSGEGPGYVFRVGKGSAKPEDIGNVTIAGRFNRDGFDRPVRVVFMYDHVNKKGSYTLTQGSGSSATPTDSFMFDLDLPALVGANEAYFGFTGSAYSGWMQTVYAVSGVAVTDETTVPTVARPGGVMTVAAGASRSFQTFGDKGNSGFLMDTLTYGDRTTLDIAPLNVLDAPNSFAGFETYDGAGTLVKTGSGNFGAVGEAAKDVTLEVAAGGVVLRQEKPAGDPAKWDWVFSAGRLGYDFINIGAHGGLVLGENRSSRGVAAFARHKVDVTGKWRLSFDAYPQGMLSDGRTFEANQAAFACVLTDDERGFNFDPSVCGGFEAGCGYDADFIGIGKAIGLGVCPGWYLGESCKFDGLIMGGMNTCLKAVAFDSSPTFTSSYVANGDVVHCTIEYDQETSTKTLTVQHNNETAATKTRNVEVLNRIPSGKARLMFSLGTGNAYSMRCEFANIRFERLDGKDEVAQTTESLASLKATAATVPVFCETETAGGVFKITNGVTLPADGALAVEAPYAPATLDVGTLTANGAATLDLGTNVTTSVDAATGVTTLTVNGGTLRLTSATALPEGTRVFLTDDAKLALDFEGTLKLRRLVRNGKSVMSYVDASLDWVSGTGTIYPTRGLSIIVR